MRDDLIYLSPPDVGELERAMLLEAFDSGWIAPLGPHVDRFEKAMAEHLAIPQAAALSSGTAALHLALHLLGVAAGDRVFVSDLTFVASANAVRYLGAIPVFIDSEAQSWNMDPEQLGRALEDANRANRLPKVVMIVDIFGQCGDFDALRAQCKRFSIPILEDAAEALGADYRGGHATPQPAGTLGDIGVFSFNGNKIITTSGGGMLVADDERLVERARWLAAQAREPVSGYEHRTLGFNYRLSNLLAGVGLAQLQQLDLRVQSRRHTNARYRQALTDLPGLSFQPEAPWGRSTSWLSCIQIDRDEFGCTPQKIVERLESQKIQCRPVWKPMHLQPLYAECERYGGELCERLSANGLCLPSGSTLTDSDRARVIDALRACHRP